MTAAYNTIANESNLFRKKKLFPYVKITPELAKDFFTHNDANRPFSNRKAKQYAELMKEGKWISSSLVISFSADGKLQNGQHRLSGIIQSGVPIEMHVETGLPTEAFSVMDIGKVRSAGDTVATMGFKNYTVVAQLVRYLISWDINDDYHLNTQKVSSNQDVKAYLEMITEDERENIRRIATKSSNLYNAFRIFSAPTYAFLYLIFSRINQEDADKFFYLMTTGDCVGLNSNSSIFLLRKKSEEFMRNKNHSVNINYRVAFVIKAWNFFRVKKEIKMLSWDDRQDFPTPQ